MHRIPRKKHEFLKKSYCETSGRHTFPDDSVRLARLDQVAGSLDRRQRLDGWTADAEVPQGDVDALSSTRLDDPRALSGAALGGLSYHAADVATPRCEDEGRSWQTRPSVTNYHYRHR